MLSPRSKLNEQPLYIYPPSLYFVNLVEAIDPVSDVIHAVDKNGREHVGKQKSRHYYINNKVNDKVDLVVLLWLQTFSN
jgi:hypothetical protein